ncbi:cAMP-regulated phosphoprotein family protein Igo1 [Coccidioides immitis RS]|uniref:mRNA stability protein n=2 Tax=Coccidioides immitis TaxID=5501 RepID=J3K9S7_COCIM|nr:cAMP-regulated phosphoprotein family protein Igo1 [Coccidioides immitis RS]EAS31699.3 cAMP-regulated phosphoprotein family protein Igo1 [Coccidioides immitis RS]KMP04358.1 endosulphine family protein [Coccidioides immitis RMSCC 2394]TPX24446.1 hypothetical protein DIZ76_013793 [Coccidioides immitis]
MNPHQQNKIDINSLSPDEQRLLRLYGKIPNKKDLLQNKLKERKYFDSGDYALSKAGKASDVGVTSIGSRHPVPENIPHLTATSPPQASPIPGHFNGHSPTQTGGSHNGLPVGMSRSPIRESNFPHRKSSLGDSGLGEEGQKERSKDAGEGLTSAEARNRDTKEGSISPPRVTGGLPIRR